MKTTAYRSARAGRSLPLTLAILVHVVVLCMLLLQRCDSTKEPPLKKPPKPTEEEVVSIKLIATSKEGSYQCESTYTGVGLMSLGGRVWNIAEDGPAWKAGIRDGDILQGLDDIHPGKYPVGTWITIKKLVGGKWIPVRIMIDTICRN